MATPRVRFAPSPTGYLHIGGARTALFNWLYARRRGGTFILRMEDTDRERSTPESVRAIIDGLRWLGIDWDEGPEVGGARGPYFQTERLPLYREWADKLIAMGRAYRCYCTREEIDARRAIFEREKRTYRYEGTCRELLAPPPGKAGHVVRFKMPPGEGTVTFADKVLGRISKQYSDLDDWVMLRGDGIPLYNYGCVIDDHLMQITLVGRGQEHVNSTFPQLMLYRALEWEPPELAHFPLILGPDREKLSKRLHPEADVMLHKRSGILPEALINFVARLGWSHGDDEVIPRERLIEWFDFEHVGATSGVWSPDKLLWLNQQYLKMLPPRAIAERLVPFLAEVGVSAAADDRLEKIVLAFRERAKTLKEMAEKVRYFFTAGVELDIAAAAKHLSSAAKPLLAQVLERLRGAEWSPQALEQVIKAVSEQAGVGMGKVAQPVRVALTGNVTSPPIGDTLELVGRDEALRRIEAALGRIG
ncbi:MAG: glutamate--tRNA ligase [Myxococcales bacterium]|nr:glutamate--tRNA ligase [Myxococcales bacterium]